MTSRDFDNAFAEVHLVGQSGGSRSSGTPIRYGLEHEAREIPYDFLFHALFDTSRRPYAIWRPSPPYMAGFSNTLRHMVIGQSVEKWFTQNRLRLWSRAWRHALLTHYALTTMRLHGRHPPTPEHVPLDEAWRVAEWLAAHSFRTLLHDLATLTRNTVRFGRGTTTELLATPTPLQQRVFDLLGLKPTL